MNRANDPGEKVTAPPAKDPEIAAATERAAAKVPDAVDRAGDNTPTRPGSEASKASAGLADHSKHPPNERAESAEVSMTGSNEERKK